MGLREIITILLIIGIIIIIIFNILSKFTPKLIKIIANSIGILSWGTRSKIQAITGIFKFKIFKDTTYYERKINYNNYSIKQEKLKLELPESNKEEINNKISFLEVNNSKYQKIVDKYFKIRHDKIINKSIERNHRNEVRYQRQLRFDKKEKELKEKNFKNDYKLNVFCEKITIKQKKHSENILNKINESYLNYEQKLENFNVNATRNIITFPIVINYVLLFLFKFIFYTIFLISKLLNFVFVFLVKFILAIYEFVIKFFVFILKAPKRFFRFIVNFPRRFFNGIMVFFTTNFRENILGYIYIFPLVFLLIVFMFTPIVNTLLISFKQEYNFFTGEFKGWGLSGYKSVIKDPLFVSAIKNTFFLVFISVPISVALALLFSVALNSIKKFQGFLQTIFFLPYITNTIAITFVFTVIFTDGKKGLFNSILVLFGKDPVAFFGPTTKWTSAMAIIIIYSVWNALAFKIMVFLSGLQNINKQYYQAAKIDGAPKFKTFYKITIPLLSPMIAYVTITSVIGTFKAYTSIVGLYGETFGPYGQQGSPYITLVGFIMSKMKNVLVIGSYTKAASGSVILLGIILVFTGIQMYFSSKKVHY